MALEDTIIRLLQSQFILKIDDAYHGESVRDFTKCIRQIRELYKSIDIFRYATISAFVGKHGDYEGKGVSMQMQNIHSLERDNLVVNFVNDETIQVLPSDEFDGNSLSNDTFVYCWKRDEDRADLFMIKGKLVPFSEDDTPVEGSFFAVKTYNDLDEALTNYRDNVAPMCRGKALEDSMTPTRLFFYAAPEDLLQQALFDYLDSRLRQCDVKREHNVDESKPVDIKVRWRGTSHMALIEIKWVGKSLKADGSGFSAVYADARAKAGASQLVEYIDNNLDSFPRDVTIGYLAVYDLRRHKNTDPTSTMISRVDANYYKDKEIEYNPQYELIRKDYKRPYRFFVKVSNSAYQD
ncbi:MAG: hypothetical protein J5374_10655 [Bacteroidales bacterium]|nr:hypothetical protein [Bacteroidales bacterium]